MAADVKNTHARKCMSTTSSVAVLPGRDMVTIGSYPAKHFVEMPSGAPSVSRTAFARRPLKSITSDRIEAIRT